MIQFGNMVCGTMRKNNIQIILIPLRRIYVPDFIGYII